MNVRKHPISHVYIVGAGFSFHAGLPLQTRFTDALLEDTQITKPLVGHLRSFIHDAFNHSLKARGEFWPQLEDLFTNIDLAANTGHHLGPRCSPSELRTTRRVLLARTMLMLDERYVREESRQGKMWKQLNRLLRAIPLRRSAFISLNWDTVLERRLAALRQVTNCDYGCNAQPADFPRSGCSVRRRQFGDDVDRFPVVKMHGSANWLYCDNCRRLFWFPPNRSRDVALQLLRPEEAKRLSLAANGCGKWKCKYCREVPLTTRIATFSYLKALDFPMFEKSWQTAERLLRAAKKWVFIGYSLPAADFEFKHLLKRVQLSRAIAPEFAVITGGRGTTDTYQNYQRFFGRGVKRKNAKSRDFNVFTRGLSAAAINAAVS